MRIIILEEDEYGKMAREEKVDGGEVGKFGRRKGTKTEAEQSREREVVRGDRGQNSSDKQNISHSALRTLGILAVRPTVLLLYGNLTVLSQSGQQITFVIFID